MQSKWHIISVLLTTVWNYFITFDKHIVSVASGFVLVHWRRWEIFHIHYQLAGQRVSLEEKLELNSLSDYVVHPVLVPSSHVYWALWIGLSNPQHKYIPPPVDSPHRLHSFILGETCSILAKKLKFMKFPTLDHNDCEAVNHCFRGVV